MPSWGQFMVSKSEPIAFTKVSLPYGWMGNMAPYPIVFEGKTWLTAEALFQAMRYESPKIKNLIMRAKSPMAAKMLSKSHIGKRVIVSQSQNDLDNMEMILRLKLDQHPLLKQELKKTGRRAIIEDATNRPSGSGLFWGAALQNGKWVGQNVLGNLWMKLRSEL
jgi:predicted NAD-dependent protein-ADP-ribosyltransferase YbiA (DUF1768 family)